MEGWQGAPSKVPTFGLATEAFRRLVVFTEEEGEVESAQH